MAVGVDQVSITEVKTNAYRLPTDAPEGDGTLDWESTTLVVVRITAGGQIGLGYTYSDAAAAYLIDNLLSKLLIGADCFNIPGIILKLQQEIRNSGRSGIAAMAISAIDVALWDLKAKLLSLPLARLLGQYRDSVQIYGSGGFTTYGDDALRAQLASWVERDGCRAVKMKVGRDRDQDPYRVRVAKSAIGDAELFVDANGAFSTHQARHFLAECAEADIRWFEEPVSSDDLQGLRLMCQSAAASIDIAAGEYIFTLDDARILLQSEAVDVLQADATRCGGVSGFLRVASLCDAYHLDLSAHCAPALHLHLGCSAPRLRHLEWFHDHVRIERLLFDGAPIPCNGMVEPDLSRPGLGLDFKEADAARFQISVAGK
jgi:L-alanine-DL-glutamate epimerase-like enolase superfamily enzyme